MARRPTIVDVARDAGVSKSTVSLVLQNSRLVGSDTRDNVRASMQRLGYVYNRSAAQLRGGTKGLIGLVINNLRNPYYTELAASAQAQFHSRGYVTILADTREDDELQDQVVTSMLEHGVSALMIAPSYGETVRTFDRIEHAGLPALQVLRQVDERVARFPFHSMDYATGSAVATRHLIDRGARRIAFVGGLERRAVTSERKSGYLQVMSENGLVPITMHQAADRQFGYDAAERLLSEHPRIEAAICFNDLVALGLIAGLARSGKRVGEDIAVIGFDDIEEASTSFPKLTTVDCDVSGFACNAADTLLDWLGTEDAPIDRKIYDVQLIIRDSG